MRRAAPRRSIMLALALAALAPALPARRAAAATIEVKASPARVTVADTFQIQIVISNLKGTDTPRGGEIPWPEIAEDGFQILQRGQSYQNLFGKVSITLTCAARPTRTGTIRIKPIELKLGEEVLRSPAGATVEVQPIPRSEDFFIELSASRNPVYVDQEFTLILKIYARRMAGRYANIDPFPDQRATWPRLQIPWFAGREDFDAEDFQIFVQKLDPQPQGSGFPINNYVRNEDFEQFLLRFPMQRAEETRKAADGSELSYFVYTLEKRFRAQNPGTHLFEPVIARGHVFTLQGSQPRPREVLAQSESIALAVKSVPVEGRPPTFSGGVGRFAVSASVTPTKVWVGVPMTLSLAVSGDGRLESVAPIPLKIQDQVAELFRIHDEPETGAIDQERRTKTFTYGIRPKKGGIEAIPPIAFSYFDPDAEQFVTVHTQPLPITVEEGNGSEEAVVSAAASRPARKHEAIDRVFYYPIYTRPDALESRKPSPILGWTRIGLLAGPPLACAALFLLTRRRRRLAADPALLRARGARRRAQGILAAAAAEARAGGTAESREAAARAVTGFIADRLDLPAAGMTAAEAVAALDERGAGADVRERVRGLLESCEQARYGLAGTRMGPGTGKDSEPVREAGEIIRLLGSSLR